MFTLIGYYTMFVPIGIAYGTLKLGNFLSVSFLPLFDLYETKIITVLYFLPQCA